MARRLQDMRKKMLVSVAVATGFSILSAGVDARTADAPLARGNVQCAVSAMPAQSVAVLPSVTISPAADRTQQMQNIHRGTYDAEEVSDQDDYLLAKIAMAEAEGEDTEGKALVMLVVLNRVKADGFPGSIRDVIYEKNQFSPIADGRFDRVEPDKDCWKALDMVWNDRWDGSQGALYFESRSGSAWHSENLDFLFRHGKHYFYREKER